MLKYSLCNKLNTKKDIARHTPGVPTILHLINENAWKEYIDNNTDFFWYLNTPLGRLHENDMDQPLDPKHHYFRAYWKYDPKKGYSDTVVEYFGYRVFFQFPRTTSKRLDMMWEMAKALDCHLIQGNSNIIDEKKFQKLKEKHT